jgi:hypothetical protein
MRVYLLLHISMVMTCVDLPQLLRNDLGVSLWSDYHIVGLECLKLSDRLMNNEFVW